MYNKIYSLLIPFLMITVFAACETTTEPEEDTTETAAEIVQDAENHNDEDDYTWNEGDEVNVILEDNNILITGNGASATDNSVTITAEGTYNFSGTLSDGQIIVNSEDDEIVRLVLNGVNINCANSAPIYFKNADKGMIVLTENTENYISDGTSYIFDDSENKEPNAAIFCKTDLTISGEGSLTVKGNFNDGIVSKDGLIITSGTINVNAVDDAIRGKDYLVIYNGNLTLDADGVGLKSDNTNDASLGYITIENGVINISSGGEGIEAEKDVAISSGEITISSSGKGINGIVNTEIGGGNINITSVDDAIHSNGTVTINNGTITISSNDDAIHADYDLVINDGYINITKSYEGIESSNGNITINGGEIHLISSDDGFNLAASGSVEPGSSAGNYYLNINGGYIAVNASGDGVDANASVVMSDGYLIVSGSTASNNSALDYDGSFAMNGGFMVATGTSRMAEAPSTSSSQNSILINFNTTLSAGSIIYIETESGEEIVALSPVKSYQSIALSSPLLEKNKSYTVYTGGSYSGTITDGVYSGGSYTSGTNYTSFTISSTVTSIN
ncbi:MAG: carbohydrate-binding domain-containing protein [Melioribacteraceae bacterium]|nr:carbohydrate-binding domain-containing protein [Melioribacteraceae bacterium]